VLPSSVAIPIRNILFALSNHRGSPSLCLKVDYAALLMPLLLCQMLKISRQLAARKSAQFIVHAKSPISYFLAIREFCARIDVLDLPVRYGRLGCLECGPVRSDLRQNAQLVSYYTKTGRDFNNRILPSS
jgi:hypothetical protein